jgi:hypothetical protein
MADADGALQRLALQPRFQVTELAFGAAARQRPMLQRGNTGRIVTPVFEALERVDQLPGYRLTAENPNNPAQVALPPHPHPALVMRCWWFLENQIACPDVAKPGSSSSGD